MNLSAIITAKSLPNIRLIHSSNDSLKTNELKTVEPKTNIISFPVEKSQNQPKKSMPSGILNSEQFDSLEF